MTYEDVKRIRENPTAEIDTCDIKELQRLISEAIEKQIPKKPRGDLHSVPHHRCPTCKCAIRVYEGDAYDAYCKFCGQAIDWSEVE